MGDEAPDAVQVRDLRRARDRLLAVVALVIAAIVVINAITYSLLYPEGGSEGGGEGLREPYPWQLPTAAQQVGADTTWTGRTGMLDAPVSVGAGATLRLVGCNLTVMLEDLVFWQRPAFAVARGGALELEDSTITILRDPSFERCVVCSFWPSQSSVAYIARPVNLTDAIDPVLHLEVSWWGNGTGLKVGVLPQWGTRVDVISRIDPSKPRQHEWRSYEVSLRAYRGTVPWVVVSADLPQADMALIGNVRVLDGDAPPHGDAFPTGDPYLDGWTVSGCSEPENLMRLYRPGGSYSHRAMDLWKGLIESAGEVTIRGSRLVTPDGLVRHVDYRATKEEGDPELPQSIFVSGSQGGHVAVDGSRLVIEGSLLKNVPLLTNGTAVEVRGTEFIGESDLVSMVSPSGTIEAVGFRAPVKIPSYLFRDDNDRYTWSLGVQGASPDGSLAVRDCTFEGGRLALDLSNADVALHGCTFVSVSEYVIWDHASAGLGGWAAISADNTFVGCPGNLFLRTFAVGLEVYAGTNGTGLAPPGSAWVGSDLEVYNKIDYHYSAFRDNRTWLIVPEVLVTSDGRVTVTQAPTVRLEWDRREFSVPIEPGATSMRVDYTKDPDAEWWLQVKAPVSLRAIEPASGGGAGCYTVSLEIDLRYLLAYYITVDVLLDGVLDRRIDLSNDTMYLESDGEWYYLEHNVSLGGGWHNLSVLVSGCVPLDEQNFSDVPTLIDTSSFPLLAVSNGTMTDDTMAPFEARCVLLGPGAELVVHPTLQATGTSDELAMFAVGDDGSRLLLDGSGLQGFAGLDLQLQGSISVRLDDLAVGILVVRDSYLLPDAEGIAGEVALENVTCSRLYISPFFRDVALGNSTVTGFVSIDGSYNNVVRLDSCEMTGPMVTICLQNSDLEMRNCTVSYGSYGVFKVQSIQACAIDVRDCAFDGSSLLLLRNGLYLDERLDVEVERCTFTGAFLYLGVDLTDMTNYDGMPWTVPDVRGHIGNCTFDGPSAGAVLHHGLYSELFGVNPVKGGARLYAHYITQLMVIHGDSRPPRPDSWSIIEGDGVTTAYPFYFLRGFDADGEALLDVTSGTAAESSPPPVPIVFGSPSNDRLIVMGFSTVGLLENNGEVAYEATPDWQALLEPLAGG